MIREADSSFFLVHPDHSVKHEAAANSTASADESTMVSTTDLKRRVLNFLATRNRPGLRQLEVQVEGGVVILKGRVRSYYEKQLASHCCSRVAGVIRVVDGIHVIPESDGIAVA